VMYGKSPDLRKPDTHGYLQTRCVYLGVSGRRFKSCQPDSALPQVKGHNGEPRQTPMGIHRGMYRNRYSFLAPSRSSAEKVARASLTSSSAAPGQTPLRRLSEVSVRRPSCLQVTDQPNHSGGSSSHILAVSRMRSATASTDARALSPEPPPSCGIGKMNRPLFPHCQTAEKSSRLRGRKMTSVRASLSTTSSHVSYSTRLPVIRCGSLLTCTCPASPRVVRRAFASGCNSSCSNSSAWSFFIPAPWSAVALRGHPAWRASPRVRRGRLVAARPL
jgi:hypothetical protein